MSSKSYEKRELILASAEQIFIRKGFNGVTMKDIIEECKISRGGIYLYYSSVDEVFMEVIKRHNQSKLDQAHTSAENNLDFETMLNNYFHMQKERLLHMENSLLLAMFEFFIAHKNEADKDFFSGTFYSMENAILEVLHCGIMEGCIESADIHILAEHFLFFLKGLETLAISTGISEELLDTQFDYFKKIMFRKRT